MRRHIPTEAKAGTNNDEKFAGHDNSGKSIVHTLSLSWQETQEKKSGYATVIANDFSSEGRRDGGE
jgi:hypothetical protein